MNSIRLLNPTFVTLQSSDDHNLCYHWNGRTNQIRQLQETYLWTDFVERLDQKLPLGVGLIILIPPGGEMIVVDGGNSIHDGGGGETPSGDGWGCSGETGYCCGE